MEELQKQQKYFPIIGNATLFIVPFYYGEENENQLIEDGQDNYIVSTSDDSLWDKETQMLTDEGDGSVIYPYIMSFLQGQMMDSDISLDGHLRIYSIADVDRRVNKDKAFEQRKVIKKFWNKFVQSNHCINVGTEKEPYNIRFKFINGKYQTLKPHIFIFPSARIGLLSFGIELISNNASTNDLKLLNYYLHKISKPIVKCTSEGLSIQEGCDSSIREQKEQTFNDARIYIGPHIDRKKKKNAGCPEEEFIFTWNMSTFIDTMLKDVHGIVYTSETNEAKSTPMKKFTPPRIHVFTYCGIDDSKDNRYSQEDILPELFKLSRCVNDKYLLPFESVSKDDYIQTFENVFVASTIEGTAFIALSKKQNSGFFEGFVGILALRYSWLYLLAMVQRYSLLNMDRMLTVLDAHEAKNKYNKDSDKNNNLEKHNKMLWRLMKSIRNVKVRCHFTDVSPFTQHNEFYYHCCDKLHVTRAYDEIEHKIDALNMTIDHDLQLVQNERERRLNLFLGILAALQALGVVYELISSLLFKNDLGSFTLYLILISLGSLIVYLFYRKHNKI